MNICWENSNFG